MSQVIEGMDAILRMPYGCFEQTSSSTYPNVLALDYMKRTKKLTPEIHAKAEGFIANGYQRLLTFEVPGGGFSWFGQAPANKILTAYGLMEFYDMSKVHDVDPERDSSARSSGCVAAAGRRKLEAGHVNFINEGATNRYNSDVLRITAYIAWSLENTGYQGPASKRRDSSSRAHLNGKLGCLHARRAGQFRRRLRQGSRTSRAGRCEQLLDARTEKDDQAWWTAEETGVYATRRERRRRDHRPGHAGAAQVGRGIRRPRARRCIIIASKKDATGAWGTTQATIMALRAVLLSTEKGAADVRGTVEISLNGKPVERLMLTPDNNDLLHQFVFKGVDPARRQYGGNSFQRQPADWRTRWWAGTSCRGRNSRHASRFRSAYPTTARAWRRTMSPPRPRPSGTTSTAPPTW